MGEYERINNLTFRDIIDEKLKTVIRRGARGIKRG